MQILVLIFGTVLLSNACALECYECPTEISGICSQTTECPSSVLFYSGSISSNFKFKFCTAAEDCVNGSVNIGSGNTVLTSKCCSSDLCNSQDAPDGGILSPNGKQCFQCNGQDCTKTLNCAGNEDNCIKVTGAGVNVKGCVSEQICSSKQIAQLMTFSGAVLSCCQGHLCNSASSTTAYFLLMVAPLISLLWFY
uniref:UPAR/Ly6 domain-containing protein n=1 Tax=Amphilophus citrinellus TaxID=61819 RepID=A0A3Q0R9C8_AMPCI